MHQMLGQRAKIDLHARSTRGVFIVTLIKLTLRHRPTKQHFCNCKLYYISGDNTSESTHLQDTDTCSY